MRYNMQNMVPKKGSALPVRLTEEEKVQVAKIAEETGLTSSTLIRLLISSLVVHYRENNNSLTLPLRWKKLIAEKPLGESTINFEFPLRVSAGRR